MSESGTPTRSHLLLYAARYQYPHKNAVAATLAWATEHCNVAFEVYYDAIHDGGHYGGGDAGVRNLGALTGGLVSGGRHLEAVALAILRFQTTVLCSGPVAFSNTVAAIADPGGANVVEVSEDNVIDLYDHAFAALGIVWPTSAVMLNTAPSPELAGIDAYCYPEIFSRQAIGIDVSAHPVELLGLRDRGVGRIFTCRVSLEQQTVLQAMGFEVSDLGVIEDGDDYATVTYRLAKRWEHQRQGWLIGDPVLASYWLPTACRERRAAIYGVPQSRVIDMLRADIAANTRPILGRQFEDSDFFTLSLLGQSFQLIDPNRPPLPVLQTVPSRWSSSIPDPRVSEPSDDELQMWVRQGRVLTSLVFWTGMMRETENLFALMDLLALTRLRAGIALTAQSLAWRPSPLDLLTVPYGQGGVFPHAEILLASCGTGAAIESLLRPDQLSGHLHNAQRELEHIGLPRQLWPEGWWATMDSPMIPLDRRRAPRPVRVKSSFPYLQFRFHPREARDQPPKGVTQHSKPDDRLARRLPPRLAAATLRHRAREVVRDSRLSTLFDAYRPYESFGPGPFSPELGEVVHEAGFSYMLSKSGFGSPPHTVWRDGDFVALNYTSGRWDGWTPFETVNDIHDLRRSEKSLLASGQPGWLLGGIDTCLWAFSGELWHRAPRLAAIARFVSSGGSSGRLINVTPRVLARYARVIGR
jgi:hypothetical protein